jgi:hypothetical protein
MTAPIRTPLEVGLTDLSIGQYSVGLAPSRTGEQLVQAYLELISLVRHDQPEYLREEDIDTMVEATHLDRTFIQNRVTAYLAAARVSS